MSTVYRGRASNVAEEAVKDCARGREMPLNKARPAADASPKRRSDGSDYRTDADSDYFRNLGKPGDARSAAGRPVK